MKWNILVGSLVLGLGLSTQSFGADLLDRMLGMNYNGCSDNSSCCETSSCDTDPSCGCETGCDACAPSARKCRKTPLLDLLRSCGKKNSGCDTGCSEPVCGCEDPCEASCGFEDPCAGSCGKAKKCRKTPLLDMLRGLRKSKSCSSSCEPACGCEDPCEASCGYEVDPGCGCEDPCAGSVCSSKRKRVSLLDRIFGKRCKKSSCCETASGCEASCGCEPTCGYDPGCGYESAAPVSDEPTEADKGEVGPAPVVDPSAFLPTKRRFIQTNLVR